MSYWTRIICKCGHVLMFCQCKPKSETDIVAYLKKFLPDENIERSLSTKSPVFDDFTAREFAEKTSWEETLGVFKRMYG